MIGIWYRGTFNLPSWLYFGFWFFTQIVYWLLDTSHQGGVAYLAHIGGFVLGLGFGKIITCEEYDSLVVRPEPRVQQRAVLPDNLNDNHRHSAIDQLKSLPGVAVQTSSIRNAARKVERNLSLTDQAIEQTLRILDVVQNNSGVSPNETNGWDLLSRGDNAGAVRELSQALTSYLQMPMDKKEDIVQIVSRMLEVQSSLPFPSVQLYQWARQLHNIDLSDLSLACLDWGSTDSSNIQVQKSCLLTAAQIRVERRVQPQKAWKDLQTIITMEPDGIFSNQAKELLTVFGHRQQNSHPG